MNGIRGEGGPEERSDVSWATESLPLAVRKQLLERELDRMGLRKAHGQQGATAHEGTGATQLMQGMHPQADSPAGHGD